MVSQRIQCKRRTLCLKSHLLNIMKTAFKRKKFSSKSSHPVLYILGSYLPSCKFPLLKERIVSPLELFGLLLFFLLEWALFKKGYRIDARKVMFALWKLPPSENKIMENFQMYPFTLKERNSWVNFQKEQNSAFQMSIP